MIVLYSLNARLNSNKNLHHCIIIFLLLLKNAHRHEQVVQLKADHPQTEYTDTFFASVTLTLAR